MDHEVFWISGLGVLNTAVVADAIVSALLPRGAMPASAAAMACGLLLAVCAAAGLSRLVRHSFSVIRAVRGNDGDPARRAHDVAGSKHPIASVDARS